MKRMKSNDPANNGCGSSNRHPSDTASKTADDNSLLKAVTAQSVKGHSFKLDDALMKVALLQDLESGPSSIQQQPYRKIDGRPVYHTSVNSPPFEVKDFDIAKLHKWGQLHHPMLALSSCEIGGEVKLYVDTRASGHYSLWTSTQIDEVWGFGSGASYDYVAWTPKTAGDSIQQAGFRLAHGALLVMFDVGSDEWFQDLTGYEDGPWGSQEVAWLLGAMSPSVHKTNEALKQQLDWMPSYLRPFYEKNAEVGEPTSDYYG